MDKIRSKFRRYRSMCSLNVILFLFILSLHSFAGIAVGEEAKLQADKQTPLENAFIVTQLPVGTKAEREGPLASGMLRAAYGNGGRLIIVSPDLSSRVISAGFHSACDPEVSFDGARVLFAGKRTAADNWNIFEMAIDGSGVRKVTNEKTDCRSPGYQSTLYTIISTKPWYQLTFVGSEKAGINEYGSTTNTNLYSCKLDGTMARRLTYNLSSDIDPFIMPDGRIVFASWQRAGLDRGERGRIALFGVNIDGADYAAFCTDEGKRIKHMPCVTTKGKAVFVEAERVGWAGGGTLASLTLRRPLHSYQPITDESDGLFVYPSPLADGTILVSRKKANSADDYGVYRLNPSDGAIERIFDSPEYHDIQAKAIYSRPEPDGRSSVVTEKDPYGKLYCLNVYNSDLYDSAQVPVGTVKRLRVLEGIPLTDETRSEIVPLAQRRILGEINVSGDGSFNIEVPANIPIQLQTLDDEGMALRSCGWIWAKNHEPRGCIGCHEDGELTPENVLAEAIIRPSIKLTLSPEQRRTVDFRRDVMPIIMKKCAECHGKVDSSFCLTDEAASVEISGQKVSVNRSYQSLLTASDVPGRGRYVHPGRAQASPLIRRLFGRDTSQPRAGNLAQSEQSPIHQSQCARLSEDEKRTFVEWIDMGALWDGIPGPGK